MDQAIIGQGYENLAVDSRQFDKYMGEKNPACAGFGLGFGPIIRASAQ